MVKPDLSETSLLSDMERWNSASCLQPEAGSQVQRTGHSQWPTCRVMDGLSEEAPKLDIMMSHRHSKQGLHLGESSFHSSLVRSSESCLYPESDRQTYPTTSHKQWANLRTMDGQSGNAQTQDVTTSRKQGKQGSHLSESCLQSGSDRQYMTPIDQQLPTLMAIEGQSRNNPTLDLMLSPGYSNQELYLGEGCLQSGSGRQDQIPVNHKYTNSLAMNGQSGNDPTLDRIMQGQSEQRIPPGRSIPKQSEYTLQNGSDISNQLENVHEPSMFNHGESTSSQLSSMTIQGQCDKGLPSQIAMQTVGENTVQHCLIIRKQSENGQPYFMVIPEQEGPEHSLLIQGESNISFHPEMLINNMNENGPHQSKNGPLLNMVRQEQTGNGPLPNMIRQNHSQNSTLPYMAIQDQSANWPLPNMVSQGQIGGGHPTNMLIQEQTGNGHLPNMVRQEQIGNAHLPNMVRQEQTEYSHRPNMVREEQTGNGHLPNMVRQEQTGNGPIRQNRSQNSTLPYMAIQDQSANGPLSNMVRQGQIGSGRLPNMVRQEQTEIGHLINMVRHAHTENCDLLNMVRQDQTGNYHLLNMVRQEQTEYGYRPNMVRREQIGNGHLPNMVRQEQTGNSHLPNMARQEQTGNGPLPNMIRQNRSHNRTHPYMTIQDQSGNGPLSNTVRQGQKGSGRLPNMVRQEQTEIDHLINMVRHAQTGNCHLLNMASQEQTGNGHLPNVVRQDQTGNGHRPNMVRQGQKGNGRLPNMVTQNESQDSTLPYMAIQDQSANGPLPYMVRQEETGNGHLPNMVKHGQTGNGRLSNMVRQEQTENGHIPNMARHNQSANDHWLPNMVRQNHIANSQQLTISKHRQKISTFTKNGNEPQFKILRQSGYEEAQPLKVKTDGQRENSQQFRMDAGNYPLLKECLSVDIGAKRKMPCHSHSDTSNKVGKQSEDGLHSHIDIVDDRLDPNMVINKTENNLLQNMVINTHPNMVINMSENHLYSNMVINEQTGLQTSMITQETPEKSLPSKQGLQPETCSSPNRDIDKRRKKRRCTPKPCRVCGETTTGYSYNALVCLPCKTFFYRYNSQSGKYTCRVGDDQCTINSKKTRGMCIACRLQKCFRVGMSRKERPDCIDDPAQDLCQVCGDYSAGHPFGAINCAGCKKFFLRCLEEGLTDKCKKSAQCTITPRNRKDCRYCRYKRCLQLGMCRKASVSKRKLTKKRHTEPYKEATTAGPTKAAVQIDLGQEDKEEGEVKDEDEPEREEGQEGEVDKDNSSTDQESSPDASPRISLPSPSTVVSNVDGECRMETEMISTEILDKIAAMSPEIQDGCHPDITMTTAHQQPIDARLVLNGLLQSGRLSMAPQYSSHWRRLVPQSVKALNDPGRELLEKLKGLKMCQSKQGQLLMNIICPEVLKQHDLVTDILGDFVNYAKRLPGFDRIVLDDQSSLVRAGVAECQFLTAAVLGTVSSTPPQQCSCTSGRCRSVEYQAFRQVAVKVGRMVEREQLSETQLQLLTPLCLIAADRPGLKLPAITKEVCEQYTELLVSYTQETQDNALHRVQRLFDLISYIRLLGRWHHCMLQTPQSVMRH